MNTYFPHSFRLRLYENVAEFESEQHLERFFWHFALSHLELDPLARQHNCGNGICDILAIGKNSQLVIIELKNVKDNNVIEQISSYFDALTQEKPFADRVDYSQPILLYTVCPIYGGRTEIILKYHKLQFSVFNYQIKKNDEQYRFQLKDWRTQTEIADVEIPSVLSDSSPSTSPASLNLFVKLLEKCSQEEVNLITQMRDRIYQFSNERNYKISENSKGSWIRFERTKQYPIAEIGWDKKRDSLAVYLWLPFTTINGRWNRNGFYGNHYKRTSMMRIWIEHDFVIDIGYIDKQRKSWIVVTQNELNRDQSSQPTKLKFKHGSDQYWKGLAMPRDFYIKLMGLSKELMVLNDFLELALENAWQRFQK